MWRLIGQVAAGIVAAWFITGGWTVVVALAIWAVS